MRLYGTDVRLVLITALLLGGCGDSSSLSRLRPETKEVEGKGEAGTVVISQQRTELVNRLRPQVEKFCGDCHVMPRPTSSSQQDWVEEVNQGFTLYGSSGRSDLEVPAYEDVLRFFQYQAPDKLELPGSIDGYPLTSLALRPAGVRLPGQRPPGVTNVRWIEMGLKSSPALVYCDIGTGAVNAHWPLENGAPTVRLATLLQPVHVEPCDLDGDRWIDLVVGDIGEFNAEDSDLGRVVWLRRLPEAEGFEKITLQEGLSRVADVQPGDFDGDGDQDLLVGVFGWRQTGQILLLVNEGSADGALPRFSSRLIDERHGAVHVPPVDLNGDGHLDFVALISQEHEVIEAFLNDGSGQFRRELIYQAPDPAYGSSGIELVDLDQDGDLDVLYTNGDSFDRGPKPYHSVQWLENQGGYPYKHHPLCVMPGVLNATAGDFDGDGDLDVVAVSLLARDVNQELASRDTSSVVMLEQVSKGEFKPTKVERGEHHHLSVEAGDFNRDGKLEFAVATFLREGGGDQPDLVVWWNAEQKKGQEPNR
jgi:hypothetical protein